LKGSAAKAAPVKINKRVAIGRNIFRPHLMLVLIKELKV